jgi:hypothetical protein
MKFPHEIGKVMIMKPIFSGRKIGGAKDEFDVWNYKNRFAKENNVKRKNDTFPELCTCYGCVGTT